jgi:broad specificity phosphatase PhoE
MTFMPSVTYAQYYAQSKVQWSQYKHTQSASCSMGVILQGVEQCAVLKERLMRMEGLETALWVCSPLSRAIDTMLHSCPLDIEQLVARGQLQIRGEVTEFLQTTGDIGLPASNLRRKYPMLAPAMENLPEVWWYGNLESNNPFKKHCKQFESKVRTLRRNVCTSSTFHIIRFH